MEFMRLVIECILWYNFTKLALNGTTVIVGDMDVACSKNTTIPELFD
jgi:hypothetical protein